MTDYERLSLALLGQILTGINISIVLQKTPGLENPGFETLLSEFRSTHAALLQAVNEAVRKQ